LRPVRRCGGGIRHGGSELVLQLSEGGGLVEEVEGRVAEGPGGGGQASADDGLGFVAEALGGFLGGWEVAFEHFVEDGWLLRVFLFVVGDATYFGFEILRAGFVVRVARGDDFM
jgi:hypothetical protein